MTRRALPALFGEHDVKASTVLIGTAAAGVVGYALADLLARAGVYGERVEENEFCAAPPAPAPDARRPGDDDTVCRAAAAAGAPDPGRRAE